MAFTNEDRKQICAKVLYVGARDSGKTTNFRSLYSLTSSEERAKASLLQFEEEANQAFEFLPVSLGSIHSYEFILHLYSLDLETPFEGLRKFIFTGLDGFVFVIDSCIDRLVANMDILKLLRFYLKEEGYLPAEVPHVLQFNKRDEKSILPSSTLTKTFNSFEAPEQEAVASHSKGTVETLNLIGRQLIDRVIPGFSYRPIESSEGPKYTERIDL